MTPEERRDIQTIKNMLSELLKRQWLHNGRNLDFPDINKFIPKLEPIPDLINAEKSAKAEEIIKKIKKQFSKSEEMRDKAEKR